MKDKEYLDKLRHSSAHLLAAAVLELWPNTKNTIGPSIEDGFYYDFEFENPITESDLPKIEEKMRQILPNWGKFERTEVTPDEAKKIFADNPYKLELIEELEKNNETITTYKSGDFVDLCRGGHLDNPKDEIKAFKLLSLAGAYWKGSEKNKMLTRIYGTSFPTQEELDKYLAQQEEAKKRDHRILGRDLKLFVSSDLVGKGLPLLTPKGATIRRELERFIVDEELRRGYEHVITPSLAKVDLYKTSGHYPYYKDTMYPVMKVDDEELILRPMTCPHHFMLYKSELRSYKELPIRFAELAHQFRYEKSGELTGLFRVRMFTLSDAHIFIQPEKAKEEIKGVLDLIDYVNQVLGLKKGEDYRFRLSLGDRGDNDKYYKDDEAWDYAENVLREVLKETDAPFFEAPKEAAFYGPKIDVQMKNISGKEETAYTIQYDFVMPKRFNLAYIDENNQEKQPIVIHRSALGAFERIMGFLIEHYGGAFPTWLSPTQVMVIPISDKNIDYGKKLLDQLKSSKIRAEIDTRSEPMGAKIRDAQLQKIPYMIIIGPKEEAESTISIRNRKGENQSNIKIEDFITTLLKEIDSKALL